MADVVDLRQRWGMSKAAMDAARIKGLAGREQLHAEARHRLIRQATEALEAYARVDGEAEARRLSELAIARACRPRW